MNIIESINVLNAEKEIKQEELKVFPDNVYLRQYCDAVDCVVSLALSSINFYSLMIDKHLPGMVILEDGGN